VPWRSSTLLLPSLSDATPIRPLGAPPAPTLEYSTVFPSASTTGFCCAFSPLLLSGRVKSTGAPPVAGSFARPVERVDPPTIQPLAAQVYLATPASPITTGAP